MNTGKEIILTIINQKGSCIRPSYVSCQGCPLAIESLKSIAITCKFNSRTEIYAGAVTFFLNNYGSKNDLVEAMI